MSLLLELYNIKQKISECSEPLPRQVVQKHHRLDENVIADTNSDEQRESVLSWMLQKQELLRVLPLCIHCTRKTDWRPKSKRLIDTHQSWKANSKSKKKKKSYGEEDVVEAVIQAIVPGAKLKSYLESRDDLTLQVLRQIYRPITLRRMPQSFITPLHMLYRSPKKLLFSFWCEQWIWGNKLSSLQRELLEKMTAAYNLQIERNNKLSATVRQKQKLGRWQRNLCTQTKQ